jgi:putative membrane protein
LKLHPIGVFCRGLLMGAADVVPGVSGGTIALITGIYQRLINALVAWDREAAGLLLTGRWRVFWYRIDGPFVGVLLAGMLTAVFTLASSIDWLLSHYPQPLWAFFSGLILMSGLALVRDETDLASMDGLLLFTVGVALVVTLALMPSLAFPAGLPGFFFGGALAICAMILPGISGSFVLLILGMYPQVLAAVKDVQLLPLGVFAIGCATGLLAFSRALQWLLARARRRAMAFLGGVLLGSLVSIWPWKVSAMPGLSDIASDLTRPVLPTHVLVTDPQLGACIASFLCGVLIVWSLRRGTSWING